MIVEPKTSKKKELEERGKMERELNTLTLYGWNADLFNEDSIHRHHGDALMILNSSKKRFVSFKTFSQQ